MGKKGKERKTETSSPLTTLIVALISSTIFFLIGVVVGKEYAIREGLAPTAEKVETAYGEKAEHVVPDTSDTGEGKDQEKVDITFYDQLTKVGDQELSRGGAEVYPDAVKKKNRSVIPKRQRQTPPSLPNASREKEGDYALQVAAFRDKKRALSMAEALKGAGYTPHILRVTIPGRSGTYYRVWVGFFSSIAEAERAKRKLLRETSLRISKATIVKR